MFKEERFLIALACLLSTINCKIINTKCGAISGTTTNILGKNVDVYLGVPYAQPPVGELRFKPPVPVKQWNGTYNATKNPPCCMQPFASQQSSEDCLYLNIWVPSNAKNSTSVMVYYHGGTFWTGCINGAFNGTGMAAVEGVIVVFVAYRLGPLGFFCSETDDARGNMGMKDQVMGLEWVKSNIGHFGGDPSNITIFGQSAGSIAVSLHLVSPLTKGLFNSAIMQSGTADMLEPIIIRNSSLIKSRSTILAVVVRCASATEDISSNPRVMTCMRNIDASFLVIADTIITLLHLVLPVNPWFGFFTPIYGDNFLPRHPILDMAVGNIHAENLMIGSVKDEGSLFLVQFANPLLLLIDDPLVLSILSAKPLAQLYIQTMFRCLNNIRPKDVITYYLANTTCIDPTLLKRTYDSEGDMLLHCPCVLLAENSSAHGKTVYDYIFTHRWSQSTDPKWMGSTHGAEVRFVFGDPLINPNSYLPEEIQFSRQLVGCWTSFAKHGRPNYGKYSAVWTPYKTVGRVAVDLNPFNVSTINPLKPSCFFWNKYNQY